jgi:protein-disulfide isomerase
MRIDFHILLVGVLCLAPCCAHSTEPASSAAPLATVAGVPISDDDLLPLIQTQLQQLRSQEYQVKSRALETVIERRLLADAAKERSLSVEELLKQEVDPKVQEPTESEIETYYLGQKERLKRPLDEIKPQLYQALRDAKRELVRTEYVRGLRKQANVAILLSPPKVKVDFDTDRVRGNPNAPVTIIEFSDFQCPFCKQAFATLKEVLARYPNQVRLAYRDFPLTQIHPQAQFAAEASHCAAEQGRYWDYHDQLFASGAQLDRASLAGYAHTLKLNEKKFEQCLSSGKFSTVIEKDIKEGTQAGVVATPTFFINGIYLNGAQPLESFARVIDEELARARPTASQ